MPIDHTKSRDPADPGPIGTQSMDAAPRPPETTPSLPETGMKRLFGFLRRRDPEPAPAEAVIEEDPDEHDPGPIGTIPSS